MASSTLMKLLVELGVDADDYMQEMDKAEAKAGTTGKSITKGIGGALAGLGAIAITAMTAVAGALASTIQPASDLNETISKSQVVFGNMGDDILKWGESSATALGMSQNAAIGAAATYGNLFRSMGIGITTSYDMSTGLVELAADLASFNNMDPTVVLDALRSGLSGETEPLKKLGININQALLEQKALSMGLWDGVGALDASQKAQATYALAMEQSTLAQGDFSRTADGLANQQRIMTANFENIKATIGTGLLPVIAPLVGGFNDLLGGIQDIVAGSDDMDSKMGKIGDLVGGFVDGIVSQVPSLLQSGVLMITKIVEGLVSAFPAMMPAIVQLLMSLVNGIVTLLPMLLETGLQIIIALALGIAQALPTLIPTMVQMLMDMVMILIENLPLLIDAGLQIVIGLINGMVTAIPMLLEMLPVLIETIVDVLITSLPLIMDAAVEIILALVNGIVQNIPLIINTIILVVMALLEAIVKLLPLLLVAGIDMVKQIGDGVIESVQLLRQNGVALMQGFWEGIKSKFNEIIQGVKDFMGELLSKLKGILGIKSPSKVMEGIGENVMMGFANGLENLSAIPANVMLDATGTVTGSVAGSGATEFPGGSYSGPTAEDIATAIIRKQMAYGMLG